jgi:steroid delta-isomerase-like uncharacterized protein
MSEPSGTSPHELLNLKWIQAFNDKDWAAEAACRTDDFLAHMSGAPGSLDADGWSAFMHAFFSAFPDAQITVNASLAGGDLVASRWTLVGTHLGPFQGTAPTGRQVTMAGVDFSRVVEGRIGEHWAQFDVLGVLVQIGALAPAG